MKSLQIQINQIGKKNKVIDLNEKGSVYITMGNYTYYFDNSTGECIIERWLTNEEEPCERPTDWKNIFDMSALEYLNQHLNK